MGDLLFNIRIGTRHFQLTRDWKVSVSINPYHIGYPDGFFAVYTAFGRQWY